MEEFEDEEDSLNWEAEYECYDCEKIFLIIRTK